MIVGNESNGLSQEIIAALDQKIKIDHASTNNAESLNVGIATAVLLYAISLKM